MKAVAYSIKAFEKEPLCVACSKRHDVTLISNFLDIDSVSFAKGKDAVIVATNDDLSAPVIDALADLGIGFIATRSTGMDHIDERAAARRGIRIANASAYSPEAVAEHAVGLAIALSRRLVTAVVRGREFDFRLNELLGFNFKGKTVGVVGLGAIGMAAAAIFKGMGCTVIAHDTRCFDEPEYPMVDLRELFRRSDVITLHVPLTPETKHLVCKETLRMMKQGVMLINTSRGGVLNTSDVLPALESGRVGYLGIDVYENERGLFFYDHRHDPDKDLLLLSLLRHPNVLVTPHQGFLTVEAVKEIAELTVKNLDDWERNVMRVDA